MPTASAASELCFHWEEQSIKATARQLHEKLIAFNLVRKLQPLGENSTAFWSLDHWLSGLEEIN